jgi:hypothetical protein
MAQHDSDARINREAKPVGLPKRSPLALTARSKRLGMVI